LKNKFHLLIGLFIIFLTPPTNLAAQHSSKGLLSIAFNHYVDEQILNLDNTVYKNIFGQTFTVGNFKYYISNIHLLKADGKEFISPDYFLINEEEITSKKIMVNNIPAGEYISISFMIGVDSARNCSGAQSGALDPSNAMFWAWNTGYIFLKLEGKSSFSKAPGNIFEYHIGGYKQPSNCIRTVSLKLEKPLEISNNITSEIKIKVNAGEILKTPTDIDFSIMPTVTDSHNAATIANNYKDMFTIQK
jgi:hypothetical protein